MGMNIVYSNATDTEGNKISLTETEAKNLYAEIWDSDELINKLAAEAVGTDQPEKAGQARELLDMIVYQAAKTYCAKKAPLLPTCAHPITVEDLTHEAFLEYLSLDLAYLVRSLKSVKPYIVRALVQNRSRSFTAAMDFLPVASKVTSSTRKELRENKRKNGVYTCSDPAVNAALAFSGASLDAPIRSGDNTANSSEANTTAECYADETAQDGFDLVTSDQNLCDLIEKIPNPVVRVVMAVSMSANLICRDSSSAIKYDPNSRASAKKLCLEKYGIDEADFEKFYGDGKTILKYMKNRIQL